MILLKNGPFELKVFKAFITQRLEKAHERLLTTWYPSILNVFYQGSKRNEWSSIPNCQVEAFFRMVALMLADHIRGFIRETALDFVAMFDSSETAARFTIPHAHAVQFTIRPVLDSKKIIFDPPTAEIEESVLRLLDLIFTAADKIPKIETQLFATSQAPANAANNSGTRVGMNPVKPEQCISVCFEETYPGFTASLRNKLKENIGEQLNAPHAYLSEFEKHRALISKRLELNVNEFLEVEKSQDKMMEEVKRYRNMGIQSIFVAYPFSVQFPLVDLQCADFIKDLSDRALGLANLIIEKMSGDIKIENDAYYLFDVELLYRLRRWQKY